MPHVADFFRVNVRVHWADTDAAGIVWFGNFLRFFEEAEDELFRALGKTRLELIRVEAHERDTQRLVCEGGYRVACVTADTFKPREFPPGMRLLIKRLPDIIAEQASPRRPLKPGWT